MKSTLLITILSCVMASSLLADAGDARALGSSVPSSHAMLANDHGMLLSSDDIAGEIAILPQAAATDAPAPQTGSAEGESKLPIGIILFFVLLALGIAPLAKSKGKILETPKAAGVVFLLCISPVGLFIDFQDVRFPSDQQGYAPEQPIPFSHKLHAGTDSLGIPCQYCHTAVMEGRHATIPSTNTCANCHQVLVAGAPKSEREANIKKVKQYINDERPIRWVRVHRLPDFVRFNHSAHTTKGVDCTECHGQVEDMDVMRHDKAHTMGFCLDCHRTKNADSREDDNPHNDLRAPIDSCGACHH